MAEITKLKASELPEVDVLTKEEIEALLPQLDEIIKWAKNLQEFALEGALNGVNYKGYKVVEGRANRSFAVSDKELIATAELNGIDKALLYGEPKVLSVAQLEKQVGAAAFRKVFEGLVERKVGKPTLVPDTDPREDYDTTRALKEFEEVLK